MKLKIIITWILFLCSYGIIAQTIPKKYYATIIYTDGHTSKGKIISVNDSSLIISSRDTLSIPIANIKTIKIRREYKHLPISIFLVSSSALVSGLIAHNDYKPSGFLDLGPVVATISGVVLGVTLIGSPLTIVVYFIKQISRKKYQINGSQAIYSKIKPTLEKYKYKP